MDRDICNVHVKQTSKSAIVYGDEEYRVRCHELSSYITINEVNMRTEVGNSYIVCTVTKFTIQRESEGLKYVTDLT
jgi:hypothetical protein